MKKLKRLESNSKKTFDEPGMIESGKPELTKEKENSQGY